MQEIPLGRLSFARLGESPCHRMELATEFKKGKNVRSRVENGPC